MKCRIELGVIEFRSLWDAEHHPHSTAIQERHLRHVEKQPQAERVAIKRDRLRNVMHDDRDLTYLAVAKVTHRTFLVLEP